MPKPMPTPLVAIVTAAVLLTGCSGSPDATAEPLANGSQMSSPGATVQPVEPPQPTETAAELSPQDTFLAWLAASRKPDAPLACSYLNQELQERMLDEFKSDLGAAFASCEEMTEKTAAVYALSEASAEVSIQTISETAGHAVLNATYVDNQKCVTVELVKDGSKWIMTEQGGLCGAG